MSEQKPTPGRPDWLDCWLENPMSAELFLKRVAAYIRTLEATAGAIQPLPETGGAKPTQQDIDVRNLRFYAEMFREHEWSTVQIHWGVFEQTLCEIATRISAALETAAELARVKEENQALDDNCNEALGALSSVAAAFGVPWQPDMDTQALVVRVVKERDRLRERNKELLETREAAQRALSNDPLGLSDFGDGRFTIEAIDAAIARAKE